MERISGYQLVLAACVLTTIITMSYLPSQAIHYARQHVYLSVLLSFAVLLLPLWLAAKVSARFKDSNLFQVIAQEYPLIGRPISALYLVFFLLILARDVRILTEFCSIFLLQNTPPYIIASLMILPAVMMVRGGQELLIRMTELVVPVLLTSYLMVPALGIKDADINMFKPLFDFHWAGIGRGWWCMLGFMGDIILLPFLISKSTFRFRFGFYGLGISTIVILTTIFLQITVVGIQVSSHMTFATHELVRQLQLTDFLDRFELVLVAFYFPCAIIKVTYVLSLLCSGCEHLFPRLSARLLAAPLGILGLLCAFWFYADLIQLYHLNRLWPVLIVIFGFLFPALIFLVWRKRKPSPE